MFRRYADDGASIADLARWLTEQDVPTRTGKHRWDRSVIWGMLRNPAYAGAAMFGKTMVVHESAGLNRVARLQGRVHPTRVQDRRPAPRGVDRDPGAGDRHRGDLRPGRATAGRQQAIRRPQHQDPVAAARPGRVRGCGYGYYRTITRTTNKKIHYYRCLGSDDYRYEGGRVCANKPVRADYLDTVVWDHITALLADPALIRAEIDKRLHGARTSDPAVARATHGWRPRWPRPATASPA